MSLLLEVGCDPNIREFAHGEYMLLYYCHKEKKHQAFEMMVKEGKADPNAKNLDNSSTYGMLFYRSCLPIYQTEEWQAPQHLSLMIEHLEEIDMHKQCVWIDNLRQLYTPIYWYFKRVLQKTKKKDEKRD